MNKFQLNIKYLQDYIVPCILSQEYKNDRGFFLSKKLEDQRILLAYLTFNKDIHILIKTPNKEKVLVYSNANSVLYTKTEYIKKYGIIRYTPLFATLFHIEQNLNKNISFSKSPGIILGTFERVGSTWLMDLINDYGRSQVEPFKQHSNIDFILPEDKLAWSSTEINHLINLSPFTSLWYRNFLSDQYQPELQVIKETSIFLKIGFIIEMYSDETPILILKRDIRGIYSSFKKNNTFIRWEYEVKFNEVRNSINNSSFLKVLLPLLSLPATTWIEKILFLMAVNNLGLIYATKDSSKNILELSYEELVKDTVKYNKKVANLFGKNNLQLSTYKNLAINKSEFNTNKRKETPHDWIDILSQNEISQIESNLDIVLAVIKNNFPSEIYKRFKQLIYIEKDVEKKSTTKADEYDFQTKYSQDSLLVYEGNISDIENQFKYIKVSNKDISISNILVTNQQYCSFLNVLKRIGISNSINGMNIFYNQNLITERGSRITYKNKKYHVVKGYENHPVCWVSWIGAMVFAIFVNATLPSSKEWDLVNKAFPATGERNTDNFVGNTTDVYQYKDINGIYDLYGNIKIWTNDWFPLNSMKGISKTTRSFAWNSKSARGDATYKQMYLSASTLGIRLVKSNSVRSEATKIKLIKELVKYICSEENNDKSVFDVNKEISLLLH